MTSPATSEDSVSLLRLRWLSATAAVLIVGGLIAVAFVGGREKTVDASLVVDAVKGTAQVADSYSFESITEIAAGGSGASLHYEGAVDRASDRSKIDYSVEGRDGPDLLIVAEGTRVYLAVPKEHRVRTGGKAWATADSAPAEVTQLIDAGRRDLSVFVAGASSKATVVGSQELRGSATTHYRLRVSGDEMLNSLLTGPLGGAFPLDTFAGNVTIEVDPVDVWLDASRRLRRIDVVVRLSAGALSGEIRFSQELFDFGVAATIDLPPPDQVATLGSADELAVLTRSASELSN
ncbi:MAG: hypothetical protein ACR2H3_09010 [Acidimicrobiales bacterium]